MNREWVNIWKDIVMVYFYGNVPNTVNNPPEIQTGVYGVTSTPKYYVTSCMDIYSYYEEICATVSHTR
jgi:hypothetical protein